MTRKLNEADRAAVDLMFDRINVAANGGRSDGNGRGEGIYAAGGLVPEERLTALDGMLSLLDIMPAPEPPTDLAVRTLARLGRVAGVMSAAALSPTAFIDPTQPMA